MDEQHHQNQPYSMADFRHLMAEAPPHPEMFPSHHQILQPVEMVTAVAGHGQMQVHSCTSGGLHEFPANPSAAAAAAAFEGGDGRSMRWPRHETLTLLEIRSRLDSRFREANQRGPLWDEVSRIMSEEHGYRRSGKKCREKFENLYKYYKKTKEGKAGRQDGKNYRFFRQLDALYSGHTSSNALTDSSMPEAQDLVNSLGSYHSSIVSLQLTNATSDNHETTPHQSQKISDSLSLSSSSDFDTSSSNDNSNIGTTGLMVDDVSADRSATMKKRRGGRSWKAKIKKFIDSRMRKLMEKQEAWVEKMMRSLEEKERERMLRKEEWRRQEIARIDKEHRLWAEERAWIEARDAALMEALHKLTSRSSSDHMMSTERKVSTTKTNGGDAAMDGSLMKSKGYPDKKRKDNPSRCSGNNYFQGDNESMYQQSVIPFCEITEQGSNTARVHWLNDSFPPFISNAGNVLQDSCSRFLMGDGESLWENYGVKLHKGEN